MSKPKEMTPFTNATYVINKSAHKGVPIMIWAIYEAVEPFLSKEETLELTKTAISAAEFAKEQRDLKTRDAKRLLGKLQGSIISDAYELEKR